MSEKDELCGAPAAIGMVVLALLFGGVVLAIYPGWDSVGEFLKSSAAASWVQAIGSISAVGVAIFVPYKIHANQIENQKINRIYKASVFRPLVRLKIAPIEEFSNFFDYCLNNRGRYHDRKISCQDCIDIINKLNLVNQDEISLMAEVEPEFAYDIAYITNMVKTISFKLNTRIVMNKELPLFEEAKYYIDLNKKILDAIKKLEW